MAGQLAHAVPSTTLADLLERILDKGVVISGDIRINLVDVELLSIQIRLVICSVERAKEMGIDWWTRADYLSGPQATDRSLATGPELETLQREVSDLRERLAAYEGSAP